MHFGFPSKTAPQRSPAARAAVAKLGLCTAGFGAEAGARSATSGEASGALELAAQAGMRLIDTSPLYGEAETMVGRALPFNTPLRLVTRAASLSIGVDQVEARARGSLERLGTPSASAILADAKDLLSADGPLLWDRLQQLKDEGYFDAIGIEAEAHDDVLGLARRFKPDVMQLPAGLLDQRLIASGALSAVAALGVEVHLRSSLLQGLLFLPREGLPAPLAEAGPRLSRIRRMIAEAGADPLQAALAFALGRPEASAVVVSAASVAELRAILAAASAPAPQLEWKDFALDHAAALDSERCAYRGAA